MTNNKMLNESLKDKNKVIIEGQNVLFLGIDYHIPKGGVASVEHVYSKFIYPFNFIRTVVNGNSLIKLIIFIEAFLRFLFYMCFKKNIKIIHIHGASNASFWRKSIFILIGKLFHKKIIYHIHGGGFAIFSQKHYKYVQYILTKCDCIIALSESWKKYFENTFKCNNVIIIKNVIEPPQKHFIFHNKFTLLFLGRIGENKGFYDLLQVIKKNKDTYKNNLILFYGGDGEIEKSQKLINEYELSNIVQYQGWVSGEKKINLLNTADAYILPSYHEGLPISILEAMSYALPIISTNVGGIPEIVKNGENGFIVTPGDIQGIENAINTLMHNIDLRKQLGIKSYSMVQEHLPQYVSKQLNNLYNELLK